MAMNVTVNRSTGFSPYELLFGRDPNLPLDVIFGPPARENVPTGTTYEQYVRDLKGRMKSAIEEAREGLRRAVARQRPSLPWTGEALRTRNTGVVVLSAGQTGDIQKVRQSLDGTLDSQAATQ